MRLVLLILIGTLATAQEDHSRHEHAVAGLGAVNFPASCNASAQKLISRGAALLHSFGYEEARITFNDAAQADPRVEVEPGRQMHPRLERVAVDGPDHIDGVVYIGITGALPDDLGPEVGHAEHLVEA